MGGMVLETNMNEIVAQIEAQNRLEKSEVSAQLYFALAVEKTWAGGGAGACLLVYVALELRNVLHSPPFFPDP